MNSFNAIYLQIM